jgi:hypothetical protein
VSVANREKKYTSMKLVEVELVCVVALFVVNHLKLKVLSFCEFFFIGI